MYLIHICVIESERFSSTPSPAGVPNRFNQWLQGIANKYCTRPTDRANTCLSADPGTIALGIGGNCGIFVISSSPTSRCFFELVIMGERYNDSMSVPSRLSGIEHKQDVCDTRLSQTYIRKRRNTGHGGAETRISRSRSHKYVFERPAFFPNDTPRLAPTAKSDRLGNKALICSGLFSSLRFLDSHAVLIAFICADTRLSTWGRLHNVYLNPACSTSYLD